MNDRLFAFYDHCPRYHDGISKCEWLQLREAGRGWFWDKRRHVHHTSTYGMRGHFGGWCGFHGTSESRRRLRRVWRKRARREARRWILDASE